MLKNCIFIKSEFIQRYFSRILLLSGIPYTYLAEHLLMTASVCSWFINVRTALFFGKNKNTLQHNEKAISSNLWKTVKKTQKSKIAFKIRKSNNGFKVKNDNGPISVFMCYCSTPRWIRHISYPFLSYKHMRSILFVSNENKKSIGYVLWINPKSTRYVEKEA